MHKVAGFLGIAAMVAVVPLARADFNISVDGTNCTTGLSSTAQLQAPGGFTASCTNVSSPPLPAGVTIQTLQTNGQQTTAFSQQFTTNLIVSNNSGASQTLTLDFALSNFTFPVIGGPITAINDASGFTINQTIGMSTGQLTSCVDQSNNTAPPNHSPFCSGAAPGQAGPNMAVTVTGANTLSSPESIGTITALNAPFSLMQQITLTLANGTNANVTASQILTPVPEPAGIALLGTALLGLTTLFRKKLSSRG
jgi:hypothetical protein